MPLPAPSPPSTALVTGASSGIGLEIAKALAARGHGVTLVARRAERLEQLASELRDAHGIRAEVVPTDLADREATDRLVAEVEQRGLTVDVLVNNAGFGIYVPFAESDVERELEQLEVLVRAVVQLDAAYLPKMVQRGRGAIINVASTAGFQALPGNGTYAACKSFVLLHSEALHQEVKGTGVSVTAVCPGPVRTEFQETSEPTFDMPGVAWVSAERVAQDSLRAADRGRRVVIPGNPVVRAAFAPNRRIPTALTLPVAARMFGKGR